MTSPQQSEPILVYSCDAGGTTIRAAHLDKLQAIAGIVRKTIGAAPLAEHAREMAEEARNVFGMDACVIRLLEGDDLVLLASAGLPPQSTYTRIPVGWGISQRILASRRPLIVANVYEDATLVSAMTRLPNPFVFTTYAGAPLLAGDRVIGILGLYAIEQRQDLTEADLDCIQVMASSMSVAIANDRLYAQLLSQHDELHRETVQRQAAEQESRRLREELARVERITAMGALTATIAHEVNQPLGAIVSNAQACRRLLSKFDVKAGDIEEALQDIVADATRATQVISRVRAFLAKHETEQVPIAVDQMVDTVVRTIDDRVKAHRIRLERRLSPDLPRVCGDPVQLQQVMYNLVTNAIEAVCEKPVDHRRVSIGSRLFDAQRVCICVHDSGDGVSAEAARRLYDPFFTTKPGGMGMGLAICKSIVLAHGGRLWCEPDDGDGACFRFTLPAAEERT